MKKILLITMMAILALTASAYDFMVDGIAYNITSNTLEIAYENHNPHSRLDEKQILLWLQVLDINDCYP